MKNPWKSTKNNSPIFSLAPMEDVTNLPFRRTIAKAARPDLFVTEFTNVKSLVHPDGEKSTARRLEFLPEEKPIIAQIWGSDTEAFAAATKKISKMNFDGIDINMGCPDKAVVKTDGGSGLIDAPKLATEIIKQVKQNTDLPVSVKTRLGTTKLDGWQGWIAHLLQQNLANLTVHLRTRKEMSKVPAHYELINEILKLRDDLAPQTTITINGDIKTRAEGQKLYNLHPGIDGIMIGRGIFENPYAFEKTPEKHSQKQLLNLLKYHLQMFDKYTPEGKYEPLKKFFKIYIRDFPGAGEIREKLMQTKTTDEARDIIKLV